MVLQADMGSDENVRKGTWVKLLIKKSLSCGSADWREGPVRGEVARSECREVLCLVADIEGSFVMEECSKQSMRVHADLPGEFYAYFTFVIALEFRGPNLKKKICVCLSIDF